MGKYFEEYGQTRIGHFLEKLGDVSAPIFDIAGELTGVEGFKKLSDIIDKSEQLTDEQKLRAQLLIQKDIEEEKELTKRWEADMQSNNKFAKIVRPVIVLYVVFFFSVILVLDSSVKGFNVSSSYIDVLDMLLITTVGGYFALRQVGKYFDVKK